MIPARIIDVHRYYRTGGIDWAKVIDSQVDAIIISAGVGMGGDSLLKEQVDGAVAHAIPYMTYHIPSPNFPMRVQAEHYWNLYGVKDAWMCGDLEPPGGGVRCVNQYEAYDYLRVLEDKASRRPLAYTNPKYIIEDLKFPDWLPDYWLWLAQWIYRIWPILFYSDFESFLAKYTGALPPWVKGKVYQYKTILWQYSAKGNAQKLIASYRTNDPVFQFGIKDADLDVSIIDKADILCMMQQGQIDPTPPPTPQGEWYLINVRDRNIRSTPNSVTGRVLITLHQGDKVRIERIVSGYPGEWGLVNAYDHAGSQMGFTGYIYMNNLVKV